MKSKEPAPPEQVALDVDDGGIGSPERMKEFEADFTPPGVVAQLIDHLRDHGVQPRTILDPAAGSGVFAKACKREWPAAIVSAVEPREEELAFLEKHVDHTHIMSLEAFVAERKVRDRRMHGYELIVTNPPFSLFPVFIELCSDLIAPNGVMCFLAPTQWGQSKGGAKFLELHTPSLQARITGHVGFRGASSGTDMREYSWWMWQRPQPKHQAIGIDAWLTFQLPWLPSYARSWTQIPGRERNENDDEGDDDRRHE